MKEFYLNIDEKINKIIFSYNEQIIIIINIKYIITKK